MNPTPRQHYLPHAQAPAALSAPHVVPVLKSTAHAHPIPKPVNTALFPEVRPNAAADPQPQLPLATEGVLRYVWESKFGPMLIEVIGDEVFVNGEVVERASR